MAASRLDGRGARLAAAGLCIAAVAYLLWYDRERLFPDEEVSETSSENAAYLGCVGERYAGIDGMKADGVINERQEKLFRSRAEALCRDKFPPGAPN